MQLLEIGLRLAKGNVRIVKCCTNSDFGRKRRSNLVTNDALPSRHMSDVTFRWLRTDNLPPMLQAMLTTVSTSLLGKPSQHADRAHQ